VSIRYQLPVASPLSIRALLAGLRCAADRERAMQLRIELLRSLAADYGGASPLLLDSGTSALALAIRLSGGAAPRPVALPAYGCFDLATAVESARAGFVLYDVRPETLAPDAESLDRALALGADRIVIAHLYGHPIDAADVQQRATRWKARLIDDAAQGVGASLRGSRLGAFGDLGVLSFGRGKGRTGGGGGALLRHARSAAAVGNDVSINRERPRGVARQVVTTAAQWLLARPAMYWIPSALPFLGLGETHFRPPLPATDISDFSVGVLARMGEAMATEDARRRQRGQQYRDELDRLGIPAPRLPAGAIAGDLRLPLVAPDQMARAAREPHARRLGIMPGYPGPLSERPGFGARRQNPGEHFPGASCLAARLITLPTHSRLTEKDFGAVVGWLRRYA
jgi:perosamine synthetase